MFLARLDGSDALDTNATTPIYRQIYARISRAIAAGILKPGDRIPSARALTRELGVARGTVDAAYSLLAAEGYVQAQGQAGTVVTPGLRLQPTLPPIAASNPATTPHVETNVHVARLIPFEMGLPALDAFPKEIWRRLGTRYLRSVQAEDLTYPCAQGALRLRTQIAAYLQVSRGIACSPAQVFITSGYQQTLEMTMRALLKAGDRVWLEDPGYPPTRALLQHAQMNTVPVPVDDDGLLVRYGIKAAPDAKAAVVTPAHQSPLCVSLSLPRRLELLDWASKSRSWIIEDDYDGEYRYVSRPLPALKSLDRDGRVIYAGTFSKVLFPGLRLAYVVVPENEIERFQQAGQVFSAGAPTASQAIVTAFIADGHFGRHIQRMRKLYGERRDATAAGLSAVLGSQARIAPQPGGMHLVAHLRSPLQDTVIAKRMRDNGLHAQALTDWSSEARAGSALLLNFTNVDAQATAERLAKRILKLL